MLSVSYYLAQSDRATTLQRRFSHTKWSSVKDNSFKYVNLALDAQNQKICKSLHAEQFACKQLNP